MSQLTTSKNLKTTESQHARFLETARALGCDEDEAAFDEKLKGIVKPSFFESGNPSPNSGDSRNNRRKPKAD